MTKLLALVTLALCALVSCGAPARRNAPIERTVALQDFRNTRRFTLIDDATHSRVDQYSVVRADANTKVLTADIMDALAEHLHSNGFDEFAREGSLPASGGGGVAWGLELREGDRVQHVLGYPPGLSQDQQQTLRALRVAFLETFNQVYSMQAVELKPGESPFKAPQTTRNPGQ
mgnify:CR=1 FL=1